MAFRNAWLILVCGVLYPSLEQQGLAEENAPDFGEQVAPLLIQRCVECHQPAQASGGLVLTTGQGLLSGGDSGPALDLDAPHESYLLQRLRDGEMPPPRQGLSSRLSPSEIDVLETWVASGANWPRDRILDWFELTTELRAGRDWWSLQPIIKPRVPKASTAHRAANPIDAFILAALEDQGLTPAPPADRRTLIRRLYLDLIGLPPTVEQIERFLNDTSPVAWERAVDRLLQTPQYGERWGRYWLDLARYADTSGYERDQEKPYAWKYRDWVVDALNRDLPYKSFILHQLAGDEIPSRNERSVIATGFLRLGTWNDEPNDQADYQYERLEDLVHTTTSAFLGLTVKCARCHDHKFDPITQEDYYRIAAAFWAGPIAARDAALLGGPTPAEIGLENVLAWTDVTASPEPLRLLKNGDRMQPLQAIAPAALSTIPELEQTFEPPSEGSRTTRRRFQLAQWIANPQNPLTARVLVNRLWQHHFGEGIVRTPNNFGFLADPPTHPRLLDWLAAEFLEGGGSIKRMHRMMLTSQTWQQASVHPNYQAWQQQDGTNRLWWHASRRRLDAEALRDSMLAVTGELDLSHGGESFKPSIAPEALQGLSKLAAAYQASPVENQHRRSIYGYLKRGLLPPLMTTFDLCDSTTTCGRRDVTIVPTQALALLNHEFVHDRSESLADRVLESERSVQQQVRAVWRSILKRSPMDAEMSLSLQHLEAQRGLLGEERLALASLCHVLLNCNEFMYVD